MGDSFKEPLNSLSAYGPFGETSGERGREVGISSSIPLLFKARKTYGPFGETVGPGGTLKVRESPSD